MDKELKSLYKRAINAEEWFNNNNSLELQEKFFPEFEKILERITSLTLINNTTRDINILRNCKNIQDFYIALDSFIIDELIIIATISRVGESKDNNILRSYTTNKYICSRKNIEDLKTTIVENRQYLGAGLQKIKEGVKNEKYTK